MKDYGLVSIITPSYNTGKYIAETINSVLEQTYTNWEMIIVDDCSTDDTDVVVSSYTDKRIRYLKNDRNLGAANSRNRAIRESKGKWIAFLDSDDLWVKDKLETQLQFMVEKSIVFSCGYSDYMDEEAHSLGLLDTSPKRVGRAQFLLYCWVGCLTVMYYVPTIGLIQIENIKKRNDYAMWLQISKKAPCYCLPRLLGHYRVRKGSVSHTSKWKLIKSHYELFRRCEKMSVVISILLTGVNMIMSVLRKKIYVKKVSREYFDEENIIDRSMGNR